MSGKGVDRDRTGRPYGNRYLLQHLEPRALFSMTVTGTSGSVGLNSSSGFHSGSIADAAQAGLAQATPFMGQPPSGLLPFDAVQPLSLSVQVTGNNTAIPNHQKKPSTTNFTDFGNWTISPASSLGTLTRTYTLTNTGNAPLDLSTLTITGKNASDFSIVSAPSSLAVGSSANITVVFSAAGLGKRIATLTLPSSNPKQPLYSFNIQGTALATTTIAAPTQSTSTGLVQVATTKPGKGAGAVNGQILLVTYTLHLADGTLIDASAQHASTARGFPLRLDNDYADGQPYLTKDQTDPYWEGSTNVDSGVIAGWEYGLQGIRKGEKRTLFINSDAGYGSAASGSIPGNSTLIFDVQCVSVLTRPSFAAVSHLSNGSLIVVMPGETKPNAYDGTILTLSSGQPSVSQTFDLYPIANIDASGAALSTPKLAKKPIRITGPNAADFSYSFINNTLTLTFTPHAGGTRNATVHILSNDPLHHDLRFAVQGTS